MLVDMAADAVGHVVSSSDGWSCRPASARAIA